MDEIQIDGRMGEGGGQVLRTSLSLAAALGVAVTVENVRGGRRKPGLLRQHRTALRAVRDITGGSIEGDELGASAVRFVPGGGIHGGDHRFGIGSAGSTMLVLQTVLPPLLLADAPSRIILEGGTHNPMAPPFECVAESLLPLLGRAGAAVSAELVRPGFFPAGGGEARVSIEPVKDARPMKLLEREPAGAAACEIMLHGLPEDIAEREWKAFQKKTHWDRGRLTMSPVPSSRGPANVLLARLEHGAHRTVLASFGTKDRSSELVGKILADEVRGFERTSAPVDRHLADQLMVPLALLAGGRFRTGPPTRHALTNAEVIDHFLPGAVTIGEPDDEGAVEVEVRAPLHPR